MRGSKDEHGECLPLPPPFPLKWAQIRPITKTQKCGDGSNEAGHITLMFTGEIHERLKGETEREGEGDGEGDGRGLCASVLKHGPPSFLSALVERF